MDDRSDYSGMLYTVAQVRGIDRAAIERCGIPGIELMRRAAAAAFEALHRHWPEARHVVLLAGDGNNGGDAFLLGRLALSAGYTVDAIALSPESTGDARHARAEYLAAGGRFIADAGAPLPQADVYVDGLFGTGLSRPIEGVAANLIERLATGNRRVLALDLPSGLDADSGTRRGACVRADVSVSFVAWKRGLFTADAYDFCGVRELATLGVPPPAFETAADAELLDRGLPDRLLKPRRANVNKATFGHVLVLGGDHGYGGAVRLAGEAALRCGAGLVSIATRRGNIAALNASRPELMARGIDDAIALEPMLARASVLAIGPGLGTDDWGRDLLTAALTTAKPAVIDADALNLLAQSAQSLPASVVLTPHPGEAARLLGSDVATVQRDRFAAARELASRHAAVVVLKGAGSLIADPRGRVAVCAWGNPGMASAGMGDVLTGVVAALLAQGLDAWDAARLGVLLHARAGDIAAADAPRGLVAGDLMAVLRRLVNGASA